MLSLRLGLAIGRWDWWNLKAEHTAYEWALQRAAFNVEPWGGTRDDIRTAISTVAMIQHGIGSVSEDGAKELFDHMTGYLSPRPSNELTPDQAVALLNGKRK